MTGLIKIFAIPGQFLSCWAVVVGSTSIMSGLGRWLSKVTHHLEAWGTASKAQAGFFTATLVRGSVHVDRPSGKVRERESATLPQPFLGLGNRKMPVSTQDPVGSYAVPMAGMGSNGSSATASASRFVDCCLSEDARPPMVGQRLQSRVSQGHRPARVDFPSPHLGQPASMIRQTKVCLRGVERCRQGRWAGRCH